MKKIFLLFLIFPLFAKPVNNTVYVEESIKDFDVEIRLCITKKIECVLIINNSQDVLKSVVINGTKDYTARRVYGELLIKYYHIKNGKKVVRKLNGENYIIYEDNSKEVQAFMYKLTDMKELKTYKSFSWIDDNTGKKEKVEDKEIGSSAGYFAEINSNDFIKYLENL